uniref:Uncharacterized protein n=1 Tax=Sulfolobus islandicus rod-shaped virus 1 TaxID=157898 RepID=Q5W355_SIRV1|nr:hypothetical protein [Sulfolobus islandicus rod-shaped virus 1]
MKFETLSQIVDQVFEDTTVDELQLRFREDVELNESQFKELIGQGTLVTGYEDYGTITDIYEYWETGKQYVKFLIVYYKKDEKIYIMELQMWRELKLISKP